MGTASVQQIDLEEQIGQNSSKQKTSISILDPAIYISRSRQVFEEKNTKDKKIDNNKDRGEQEWDCLHFRASFTLEVAILGFERAYVQIQFHFAPLNSPIDSRSPRQYNRFFDSISIRYLYKEKEHHLWYPERDEPVDADVTNETNTSTSAGLGVTVAGSTPVPAPEVHVQRDRKLTVARKMQSWRKGVSLEKFQASPLPSGCSIVQVTSEGASSQGNDSCLEQRLGYTESVHWDYQVESKRHTWVPEVYESVAIPITIERLFKTPRCGGPPPSEAQCKRLMHFDFQIKTRLRFMSPRCPLFTNFSKPAEYRYEFDTGRRLPLDHYLVCLVGHCPPECLPDKPTINFDDAIKAFYKAAKEKQHHNPFFLPSDQILEEDFLYPAKMEAFTKRRERADTRRKMRNERLDRQREGPKAKAEYTPQTKEEKLETPKRQDASYPVVGASARSVSPESDYVLRGQEEAAALKEMEEAKCRFRQDAEPSGLPQPSEEEEEEEEEPVPATIVPTPRPPTGPPETPEPDMVHEQPSLPHPRPKIVETRHLEKCTEIRRKETEREWRRVVVRKTEDGQSSSRSPQERFSRTLFWLAS